MLLSACGDNNTAATEAPVSVDAIYTQAAQTMQAQAALTNAAQPQATDTTFTLPTTTPTFGISTNTLEPTTIGFPTLAPPPTQTNTPYSQGGTGGRPCLRAQLEWENFADRPDWIPVMYPGEVFDKQWNLTNSGSCTWTEEFAIALVSGVNLLDFTIIRLKDLVDFPEGGIPNGKTLYLKFTITAPSSEGRYQSYYMLMDPSGQLFGLGDLGNQHWWVLFKVRDR